MKKILSIIGIIVLISGGILTYKKYMTGENTNQNTKDTQGDEDRPKNIPFEVVGTNDRQDLNWEFEPVVEKTSTHGGIINNVEEMKELWSRVSTTGPHEATDYSMPKIDFDKNSLLWYGVADAPFTHAHFEKVLEYDSFVEVSVINTFTDHGSSKLFLATIPKTGKQVHLVESSN